MTEAVPALRPDLRVVPRRVSRPGNAYLLQDATNHAVYELGEQEYFLCSRLDGLSAPTEILERYRQRFGAVLSAEAFAAFVRQLGDQGLLAGEHRRARTLPELIDPQEFLPVTSLRLVGTRGDQLLAGLARWLRRLYTRPAQVVFVAAIMLGVALFVTELGTVVDAVARLNPWLVFVGVVVSSSVVQSCRAVVHGVTCKRYGAQVFSVEIVFLYYLLPGLFCNYRGIMLLPRKSERLWVLFAGVYFQVILWSVAVIGWWLTAPGGFPNSAWLVLTVAAGLGLVLFTANPLVEMAGYHMLVTWLEMPGLRQRSLAEFGAWITGRPAAENLTARQRRWFRAYGALAFGCVVGYLVFAVLVLWLWLTYAYEGAGAVATLLVGMFMIHRPVGRYARESAPVRWLLEERGGVKRRLVRYGLLGVFVAALFLPYPYETGGPFTIIPSHRSEVRCEIDGGRVIKVLVREGDLVSAGQPIGQIDPREYERNVVATEASLEERESRLRLLKKELALLTNPPNIEAVEALEAEVRRLRTLLEDYKQQLVLTTLRSPIAGRITTPLIEQAVGKYLKQGDLFATVEQAERVRVEIRVPEADAPQVQLGARVKVVPWAYPDTTFYATVESLAPIAMAGANPNDKWVRAVAELDNQDRRLTSQITGFAKINTESIPVWLVFSRLLLRWFRVQVWYWLP